MKGIAIMAAIAALAIPVALAEGRDGTTTGHCSPGSWISVRVTQPNGELARPRFAASCRLVTSWLAPARTASGS